MFGGAAIDLDDFTLSLLGNAEVLRINDDSTHNRRVASTDTTNVWAATLGHVPNRGTDKNTTYAALFNTGSVASTVTASFDDLGLPTAGSCTATDLWGVAPPSTWKQTGRAIVAEVGATAVLLLALTDCKPVRSADAAASVAQAPPPLDQVSQAALYSDSGDHVPSTPDDSAINLWPGPAPGERPGAVGPEYAMCFTDRTPVSECKDLGVGNVTVPTMTPYLVMHADSAVIIAPGGGYNVIATVNEGVDIATCTATWTSFSSFSRTFLSSTSPHTRRIPCSTSGSY